MAELPGLKIDQRSSPYGLHEHLRRDGNGDNRLRTERIVQPRALKKGDILATGDEVLADSREGYNGGVYINLNGDWIDVPARIPIALLTAADNPPQELWEKLIRSQQ